MTRPALAAFLVWAAFAALASAAHAATAEEQFKSVYGKEYRAVTGSWETSDDVALADQLLAAARTADNSDLKALLCVKAYGLAMKDASGWPTAVAAMDLLAATVPARKAECLDKVVTIRQNVFNTAKGAAWNEAGEALVAALVPLAETKIEAEDVVGARGCCARAKEVAEKVRSARLADVEALAALVEVHARLLPLKRAIKMNPANRGARAMLMKIYLIELDDPESAAKFVERDRDDNLDKFILVAAMNVSNVPERGCIQLGDWYRGLADEAGPAGKAAMLRRAQTYYRRFLDLHTAQDLVQNKTEFVLQQVETALEELASTAPTEAEWVNLLKAANPARHSLAGKWSAKANGLAVAPFPDAYLAIPALPEGNYELQAAFTRARGTGRGVIIALPVGSGMALLRLGCGSSSGDSSYSYSSHSPYPDGYDGSGLELVKGCESHTNSTTRTPSKVAPGQHYVVDIAVTLEGSNAQVTIKLNGDDYIRWEGPQSALTCPTLRNRKRPPRAFGLGADTSTVVFDALRVRMITGQLKKL